MNKICFLFVAILTSLVFFSCRSLRIIEIETYNPSAITFPSDVKTIMIVNNSAQQPDGIGHHYISKKNGDSLISVSADSMAYYFCMSLGKAIAESPFFSDVRICDDTLRMDSLFYYVKQLSVNDVNLLCSEYGVDALIVLDKLHFMTTYYNKELVFLNGNALTVEISGELRALWPEQKEAYKIPFQDSLSWIIDEEDYYNNNDIKDLLIQNDIVTAMLYISELVGQKIHSSVVPHWTTDNRWYYTSLSSDWKEGTAYATADKWAEAEKLWEPLYNKTNNWKHKARLSSNLALCNEMTGNFDKASEYATISYNLFKEYDKKDSTYITIQKAYIEILEKRKSDDSMLSKQLNEVGNQSPASIE